MAHGRFLTAKLAPGSVIRSAIVATGTARNQAVRIQMRAVQPAAGTQNGQTADPARDAAAALFEPAGKIQRPTDEAVEGRECQPMEEIMLRKSQLLALAVLGLSIATPAMALNPQPLPPGRIAPHHELARRSESLGIVGRYPYCHAVHVGDPRKQPPIRVCP
jgi:hypothetical protein